jgi:hypothetical protein
MKILVTAAVVLALPAAALAESYRDQPTSAWFKALSSVFEGSCCDQADCRQAQSDFREGAWWALSNRSGRWVRIVDQQLTSQVSIFKDGVLCEGDPIVVADGLIARVYCFAPPPLGF